MLKRRPRTRWFAVVGMTIGAASAGACTRNPYVIGAVCPLGDGAPMTGLPAPFTDVTRAVDLPANAPAYVASNAATGSVGFADFVVEVVLRAGPGATIADKTAFGGTGWALRTGVNTLELSV